MLLNQQKWAGNALEGAGRGWIQSVLSYEVEFWVSQICKLDVLPLGLRIAAVEILALEDDLPLGDFQVISLSLID